MIDVLTLFTSAVHVLRSYQYGNTATLLAEQMADEIDKFLKGELGDLAQQLHACDDKWREIVRQKEKAISHRNERIAELQKELIEISGEFRDYRAGRAFKQETGIDPLQDWHRFKKWNENKEDQ